MGNGLDGLLDTYRSLFSGNTTFYGVHKYIGVKKGVKEEGISYTEHETLTEEQYQKHLLGTSGLGVCPLRQDNTCAFGALDVDVYDNDAYCFSLVKAIYKWNIPVLPFRTKSGGLHLYIFFRSDQSSLKYPTGSETIRLLTSIGKMLGLTCEVFPKQSIIHKENKGSWINLPYFNTDNSQQYLISPKNERTPFTEAMELCIKKQETIVDITNSLDSLPFSDGPPCLQTITLQGGPGEGEGRNVFLFNAALYFKEKDHKVFDILLDDLNDNIDDPIDAAELNTIKRSSIKQEYTYACHTSPLCDNCDKEQCATKTYGVGKSGGLFMGVTLGQLTIKRGKGTEYSWEVSKDGDDGVIHFDSPRDLMQQEVFISAVLNVLNYKVTRIKAEKYDKLLNSALELAEEIELNIADDNTLEGRVCKLVLKFITTLVTKEGKDLERGMAYLWEDRGQIMFRPDDVWKYITETNKQRNVKNADFQEVLRKMNIGHGSKKLSGRAVRVRVAMLSDVEEMIGGPLQELGDIDFEEEAQRDDDY